MFKDYYKILNIPSTATQEEIRTAYRNLCKQWHPDKNPSEDATAKMQDINEAYLILKDIEKRKRYDEEYGRFCAYKKSSKHQESKQNTSNQTTSSTQNHRTYQQYRYEYYDIKDDKVKQDVNEARKTAEDYINELLDSVKTSSEKAVRGAFEGCLPYIIIGIIGTIMSMIIFLFY